MGLSEWYSSTWQIRIVGGENLSSSFMIMLVNGNPAWFLEAVSRQVDSSGLVPKSILVISMGRSSIYRKTSILTAIELARRESRLILPAAFAVAPALTLPLPEKSQIPLPGARIVISFEAAFEVPVAPTQIPPSWLDATEYQLNRAAERANNELPSWH